MILSRYENQASEIQRQDAEERDLSHNQNVACTAYRGDGSKWPATVMTSMYTQRSIYEKLETWGDSPQLLEVAGSTKTLFLRAPEVAGSTKVAV